MSTSKAHINPKVLSWAREDAGLSLEEAAQQSSIADTKKLTAIERIQQWEAGEDTPTRNQLAALAKTYFRPVLTFYMKTPPRQSEEIPDFRTLGDHPVAQGGNILAAFVRKMKARQQEVVELLTDDGTALEPLSFIGRFALSDDPILIAADIRNELILDFTTQRGFRDKDALFRAIRLRTEELGIFVMLQGNLGSHHTNIEAEEFRGIALVNPIAPFIVINGNDAKAAHTFTLLHELAHLWLGEAGISNKSPFEGRHTENRLEALCNQIATEFLMPREAIETAWQGVTPDDVYGAVASIATDFSVSRAAAANRLWKLDFITEDQWWGLYRRYQGEWREHRERLRNRDGGPSYFVTKRSQLGGAIIGTVLGAVDAGALTYTRASRILGVNAKNFDGLRARAR